jgi:hypothetical protein
VCLFDLLLVFFRLCHDFGANVCNHKPSCLKSAMGWGIAIAIAIAIKLEACGNDKKCLRPTTGALHAFQGASGCCAGLWDGCAGGQDGPGI